MSHPSDVGVAVPDRDTAGTKSELLDDALLWEELAARLDCPAALVRLRYLTGATSVCKPAWTGSTGGFGILGGAGGFGSAKALCGGGCLGATRAGITLAFPMLLCIFWCCAAILL